MDIQVTAAEATLFQTQGYVVARGLFSRAEAEGYRQHYLTLRRRGAYPGDTAGVEIGGDDPLKRYPRMIHMHRWDEVSRQWLLAPRLNRWLTALAGREPYAVQTMLYFKPPGARGQALHQDNFYLRAKPGTCLAAWMALEDCDEANGCMRVAPGSHTWDLLCTEKADTQVSFTDVTVPLPPGQPVLAVPMAAGDVLFFNGSLVHGSYPNTSPDRFRCALIGHYIEGAAEQVAEFYHPALRMDGAPLTLERSPAGGACGVWVERDGQPVMALTGDERTRRRHE